MRLHQRPRGTGSGSALALATLRTRARASPAGYACAIAERRMCATATATPGSMLNREPMSRIADKKVAFIHYTLTDDEGEEIDSSRDGDPMPYLHGCHNIVPGLERELEGKSVGDRVRAVVAPEDGYGPSSGEAAQAVPREAFEGMEPEPGMPLMLEDDDGDQFPMWVVEVSEEAVVLSPDHPLAGVTLHFEVEIVEIRDATAVELEHGHAHPGDGHHHH